jgi:hypothetical protein
MLQNVARDSKKIARRVAGDSAGVAASKGDVFVFKADSLYLFAVPKACHRWVKVEKVVVCGLASPL